MGRMTGMTGTEGVPGGWLDPRLEVAYGDGRYNNRSLQRWLRQQRASYRVETIQRSEGAKGFVLLPKRWVVERTFAWLGRYRQLSKEYDYEPKVRPCPAIGISAVM